MLRADVMERLMKQAENEHRLRCHLLCQIVDEVCPLPPKREGPGRPVTFSDNLIMKMDLLGRLFSQDLDLYSNLIGKNAYMKDALEIFSNALNEGEECLLYGSNGEKRSYLEEIREFLGDFCQTGFVESNKALNIIYQDKRTDNGPVKKPD